MKKLLFSNWNFMRFLRLGLGLAILFQAALAANLSMGVVGLLLTLMPLLNMGCCSAAGCNVPSNKTTKKTGDINYEEVV